MTTQEVIDNSWDDDGVFPDELTPDSEYLFAHMTDETLDAVDAQADEKILDIGCGRALDLLSLKKNKPVLFGFDGSEVMIGKAVEHCNEQDIKPRLALGSAEKLPFQSESFDKVFCKGAIDHFYDPGLAIREMIRVLKPGGKMIIAVANFNNFGFRVGKLYAKAYKVFTRKELPGPHFWDKPHDHIYEFDHPFLHSLLPDNCRVDRDFGISMFWGFPKWGTFLKVLPSWLFTPMLKGLDKLGHKYPNISDVLVIRVERTRDDERKSSVTDAEIDRNENTTIGAQTMNNYSRIQGMVLCLATFLAAILFIVGVLAKNWWALAIPVGLGFLWLLGLGFWIGWTLLTIQVEPQPVNQEVEEPQMETSVEQPSE